MGCSPSKVTPKKVFTDIESEKAKRLEKLELLLQKKYDNRDNGMILCIEDYMRLDSVKYYDQKVIPDNYSNGCEEIISYDEVSALLDKIIKVPHTRQITETREGYEQCLWQFEIHIRYVKGISS